MAVSLNNKIDQWLKFFLVGVIETAKNAIETFTNIIALRDKLKRTLFYHWERDCPMQIVSNVFV